MSVLTAGTHGGGSAAQTVSRIRAEASQAADTKSDLPREKRSSSRLQMKQLSGPPVLRSSGQLRLDFSEPAEKTAGCVHARSEMSQPQTEVRVKKKSQSGDVFKEGSAEQDISVLPCFAF